MNKATYKIIKGDNYGTICLYTKDIKIATLYYNRYFEINNIDKAIHLRHIFVFLKKFDLPTNIDFYKLYTENLIFDMVTRLYCSQLPNIVIEKDGDM